MKSGSKQSKVKTVMKEWKEGKLKSSSGDKVTNPKQAIAIALSEAGMSKNKKYKGGSMKKYGDGGTAVTDSELERFKKELSNSSLTGAQRERYEELRINNELKKIEEKPKGDSSKVVNNPGQVSYEDIKAYYEEARRKNQL
jgi:hypothetical protein